MEIHQLTANAHLEIATSDDNVTYTAFQNFVIGDYTARYFKFRVSFNFKRFSFNSCCSASISNNRYA